MLVNFWEGWASIEIKRLVASSDLTDLSEQDELDELDELLLNLGGPWRCFCAVRVCRRKIQKYVILYACTAERRGQIR